MRINVLDCHENNANLNNPKDKLEMYAFITTINK